MQKRAALDENPYAGNPHVRFDEGEVAPAATPRRWSILYNKLIVSVIAMSVVFAASAVPAEAKGATAGKEKIAKTSKEVNKGIGKSEDCVKAERAIYDKLSKIRIPHFKTKRGMDLAEVIEWFRDASKKYDIEPGKPGINFVLKLDGEAPRVPFISASNIILGDLLNLVLRSVDYDYEVFKVKGALMIIISKQSVQEVNEREGEAADMPRAEFYDKVLGYVFPSFSIEPHSNLDEVVKEVVYLAMDNSGYRLSRHIHFDLCMPQIEELDGGGYPEVPAMKVSNLSCRELLRRVVGSVGYDYSVDCYRLSLNIFRDRGDKLSKIRIPYFKIKEGTDLIEVIEMLRDASKKYDIEPGKPGINFVLKLDGEAPRVPVIKTSNINLDDLLKLVLLSVGYDSKVYGNTVKIFKMK